ncbi:MAG: (2Fe-2S) ferredoxin domain-containing protein [Symploca sp. SIO1C4]|uniref:(2Fe-2S) ferredoxin domain-containing protein n=1 Tax=Symploca sp. SIO1C4 TaxID=2607765 RepID=A0A6B3N4H2_9CYAN|nr:(2Fe-2S) ferredoxin domain-containing protein [Symploca sp. SIO1C4]
MKQDFEQNFSNSQQPCVLVCQYRSCLAAGSAEVLAAFKEADLGYFKVTGADCQGQCSSGPTVRIVPEETWYCRVKLSDVPVIVEEHLQGGKRVEAKLHPRIHMRFSF